MADDLIQGLTLNDLAAALEKGCKPKSAWRIGAEHEKFVFDQQTLRRPAYDGEHGIKALLEGLKHRFGWSGVYEGEVLIGLERDGANVSLEPGGQFELSGAPLEDIHAINAETASHLDEVRAVGGDLGLGFLSLGFSPLWTREETPVMPKGRYDIMRRYMPKVGSLGLDMMLRTCTVQVNLDFASEADMVRKFRASLALQPIATALFANSPFTEGKPNGYVSYRAHIWTDTDPDRTGLLNFVFEDGFGFEAYADYARRVPMYFVKRDRYIDAAGLSFEDFLAGKLPVLPGERPSMKDWADHLTTLFPEVRLKTYLEMRGADVGPLSRLAALPALWVGLLYDDAALEGALDLIKTWTAEDRAGLRQDAARTGLKGEVAGRKVQDVAKDVVALAQQGLKGRARAMGDLADETGYLAELEEIADSGLTPADRLLELYHGPWGGDISKVYQQFAY